MRAAREQRPASATPILLLLAVLGALFSVGCPPPVAAGGGRSALADKWLRRAAQEYRSVAVDAAYDSVRQALDLAPGDEQIRVLGARVALARLDLDEALRLLRGLPGSAATALRGRAHWYKGELEAAADQLDQMLSDPDVVDPWARSVSKLARQGVGRRPYAVAGGLLATVDLPRVDPRSPVYVVPLEIDGDAALALVSTGSAEVVLDSAARGEPSWVALRFGGRLEVRDVPALTQDLSGLSRQLGTPIKALLGVNLLRRVNATLDFRGRQFVARSFVPPPPPLASRVSLYYLRGGAMVLGTALGDGPGSRAALFVDTAMRHAVALDRAGWQKLGVDARTLAVVSSGAEGELREGEVPLMRLGAFDLPGVRAVYGVPVERLERELDVDVDGVVGAGLLSEFRVTFSDGGRLLWLEQPPPPAAVAGRAALRPGPAGSAERAKPLLPPEESVGP
ncbi:MAG: hypothetical protein HY744_17775 [Deltaproteobacteria bacterium]|nr:hypothetical protein [Deltaproteobacteria bacterium]